MNKNLRLVLALALMLLAGFGCAKTKQEETPYPTDELALTAEEQVIANQLREGAVYFAYDRYDLTSQSQQVLAQNAAIMKTAPQLTVVIEGHCDERGTEEYNLALGERRARAAYEYLVNLGVTPSQLEMVSKGKMEPAILGTGEAVWAKNRRDEFRAIKLRR